MHPDETGGLVPTSSGPGPDPVEDPLHLRHRVVHGYERAYRTAGEGPALLFVHGIGDDSSTWLDVLRRMSATHTVVAPDLLGHGESAKPRADYSVAAYACGMRDLLATLDIDRVTVVGHSLGGGVAMQFAYQFPERCERLVLVGSGGLGSGVHPLLRLATAPGAGLLVPVVGTAPLRLSLGGLVTLLRMSGGLGVGDDLDYVLARYVRLLESPSRVAFLRTLRSVVDWRGQVVNMLDRCYLAEGIPTLLVWGGHDNVVPTAQAGPAHRAMPGSRLEIFEDAGHFPHHSDPERFVAVLRDFLATTSPAVYDAVRWRSRLRAGQGSAAPIRAVQEAASVEGPTAVADVVDVESAVTDVAEPAGPAAASGEPRSAVSPASPDEAVQVLPATPADDVPDAGDETGGPSRGVA